MSAGEPEKPDGTDPSGAAIAEMLGSSWPGTDKKHLDNRHEELDRIHKALSGAKDGWLSGLAHLGSENVWASAAARAANAKADTHTKSMANHEQHLVSAKGWTQQAGNLIIRTKEAIVHNVSKAVEVMNSTKNDSDDGTISDEAAGNIRTFTRQTNEAVNKWAAATARGEEDVAPEPPTLSKEEIEKARDKREDGQDQPADDATTKDNPLAAFANASFSDRGSGAASEGRPAADAEQPGTIPEVSSFSDRAGGAASEATPVVMPPAAASNPGRAPSTPPSTLSPPAPAPSPAGGAPNLSGAGTGVSGSPGAPSPLSATAGGTGVEQAASASQAAGPQAPVGGAPTDPLQAFSKGFADSAGTPVHAASTGAPPPLAPSPAVPASDATAPASTHSAPNSLTGAQAPTAPVHGQPAAGGSTGMGGMGMGGGMPSMPLGPPPTAPPAAPVAPPPAAAPPSIQPANIAGGAQIAPIPVSAVRAERDAAQSAARRTGSDPLVVARRIAAALNAPDMASPADYRFFWITAVTVDGSIVVANNYGLAYIPQQVRLPEQVKMASADESMTPGERASCATQPVAALQRWAHHHGTELRAVIATQEQLKNSDAGVHHEVLAPEDIPSSGKMVGRDRLQVIAPQAGAQLMRISDSDLVKVLPPAPVDTEPPEDRRTTLWYKVWEPLMSRSAKKNQRQLQALLEYAVHAQEQAIYAAHSATQAEDQRLAVGDFIYWQHVGQLIADALAEQEIPQGDHNQEQPTA